MVTVDPSDRELWQTWRAAAAHRTVDRAIRTLYADLDAQVAARGPTCWTSGRCCNFDAYGHRLYVTGLEIAWFAAQVLDSPPVNPLPSPRAGADGFVLPQFATPLPAACPYQVGGRCSTHEVRPMGCRVFFCQQGTERWQQELYEQFLDRLRRLHERHDLPYRYMEWRAGLAEHASACVGPTVGVG